MTDDAREPDEPADAAADGGTNEDGGDRDIEAGTDADENGDVTGRRDGRSGVAADSPVGDGSRVSDRTRDRADDPEAIREEIEALRDELASFEDDVERRTVERDSLEDELKRYVRSRARRGHAHGWGPYLVLAYGTAMAIAAFYFLEGWAAILAMLVVWTSTLGVYVLMIIIGASVSLLGLPGRLRDRIGR